MTRTAPSIAASLRGKLPPGWALAGRGGLRDALLEAIAEPVSAAEADAAVMMDEVDPRAAVRLLPDFERVLGPDPCGRDLADRTVEQRQQMAHQRWTARGGQSIAYFVDMAAKRGVSITIEEAHVSQAGAMQAGDEVVSSPEQFIWRVLLALTNPVIFTAGASAAGELLYDFDLSDIECDIRRAKPAHTEVVFVYLES